MEEKDKEFMVASYRARTISLLQSIRKLVDEWSHPERLGDLEELSADVYEILDKRYKK